MTYRFLLKGEVPAKKNSRITLRNGKTIPSKNYQKWHENALFQLIFAKKMQKLHKFLDFPLSIKITLTHGDLKRRDGDNALSSILDILQDAGIIKDDSWQFCRRLFVENTYEKNNPLCEIEINLLEQ